MRRLFWLGVVASVAGACTAGPRMAHPDPVARAAQVQHPPTPAWPRHDVLATALRAYECGRRAGRVSGSLLTVIDYSLPSTAPRLWVIDVARRRVLFHELVAHGERSGANHAVAFSNRLGSRQSSLGLFRTEDVYVGGRGYSLRLTGLERGVNDRAMERRIVMHGADYVDPAYAASSGRLGRSWGCPALRREVARPVIDRIKGGTAVFAYYPDRGWLDRSPFLACDGVQVASASVAP